METIPPGSRRTLKPLGIAKPLAAAVLVAAYAFAWNAPAADAFPDPFNTEPAARGSDAGGIEAQVAEQFTPLAVLDEPVGQAQPQAAVAHL